MLTDEQIDVFMETIERATIGHDFFCTELIIGLRRGEICVLKWENFDESSGTLMIRRTVHWEKGVELTTGDTKTYAGTRKIILPPSTADLPGERKKPH